MIFYYYQLTSEEERIVYQALKKAVEAHAKQICLQISITGQQISQVFLYMLLDYPDYFWTKGDCSIRQENSGNKVCTYITIEYLFDEEVCKTLMYRVQDALRNICDYIDDRRDTETIICLISEWFYQNIQYSVVDSLDQTIYSALVLRKSVCMGISKAILLILRLYGIECVIVLGQLFQKGVHVWNLVRINNSWYHLDLAAGYECFDSVWVKHGITNRKPLILVNEEELKVTHSLREGIIYL